MESIELTIIRNIDEFKRDNGKPPSGIYLGHRQWLQLMQEIKPELTAQPEFWGIKLFRVNEESHFKIA